MPRGKAESPITKGLTFKKKSYKSKKQGNLRGRKWKNIKQVTLHENYASITPDQPTYYSIKASPSLLPTKRYCDFSGFEAKYTDPKTRLRYCNVAVFAVIRTLSLDDIQSYLQVRRAGTALK